MTANATSPPRPKKKLILAIVVLAGVAFALLLAFIISSRSSSGNPTREGEALANAAATAMSGADAALGERLVRETDCASCHLTGDGRTAPLFDGLAPVAGQRPPSHSAEVYLYEAIVSPAAHLVEGYANAMPSDYGKRYSPADLGHMIAYLLTLTDDA